ncbi:MAG TPA: hypothetical protein VFZ00_30245 [Solirubrobacter sp.]|nr:hypothetical protein [Solirubrobacter sp.]
MLSLFGTGDMPVLIDGIPHTLSTRAAAILNDLAPDFECVWCTGWEDRADTNLPLLLDLPRGWPHITFPETASPHWKLAGIDAFAGPERALAWIDDQHEHACREWAAARRGPTLLISTDPTVGLTPEHASALRGWASHLPTAAS